MDRYEWYEIDVKDHRHSSIYSLENALVGAKKRKLNVIREVRLKAICRTKLYDDDIFLKAFRKFWRFNKYRSKLKGRTLRRKYIRILCIKSNKNVVFFRDF